MRFMTWNINSVRLRLPQLRRAIAACSPDVICLQETKTPDEFFPLAELADAGYPHAHINGMKSYNGVAILSRVPFEAQDVHVRAGRTDCRHIAAVLKPAKLKKKVEVHCLYVPAGGDIPDPAANDKFAHKLDFVDDAARWFARRYEKTDALIALGDLNIAPLENDVWSHRQLLDVVSHTPVEVEKLGRMRKSLDWTDAVRHFVPESEKCYTWWSYRNRDWKKSNRGRRLDHIWLTAPLVPHLKSHEILTKARSWDKPSDHVPVVADLDI